MKKAQGISVNVIIIAAIALLVLVVLSVIFIGRMGGWGEATNSCVSNGGKCARSGAQCGAGTYNVEASGEELTDYKVHYPIWDCKNDDQFKHCCIKITP